MFRGDWGFGVALGLILGGTIAIISIVWIIGLNYCPNSPCKYEEGYENPNNNTSHGVWQVPAPMRGTFSYESEPKYTEGDPTRYEYYDLRAQERMAHATDWIAWLSLVTGFFGILGLGAIIYTLNLQRDANKITRKIGEAQVRAYLTINSINARYVAVQSNQEITMEWSIEFKLRNSGHTPARNIWCKADIITPHAEASGEAVVAFDISGNSDGMFEVRCDVSQSGNAFVRGLADGESFNLKCRITVGFTDVFDKPCGPFNFLFGATKNFSRHGRGNGLLPIHEAGA